MRGLGIIRFVKVGSNFASAVNEALFCYVGGGDEAEPFKHKNATLVFTKVAFENVAIVSVLTDKQE